MEEDQPAGTGDAPLATVAAIIDWLLGFGVPEITPAEISARSMRILGFSSEWEARAMAHALGLADQSLAERGVQAALEVAERWLARAPVPLVIFQSGRAQIPKGIDGDLRDFLRELAQSTKKRARKGRHVIAWSRDRTYERFRTLPLRDAADLSRAKGFQEGFFASDDGKAELERLAALQRERPKGSKSAMRIQDRLWRVAGDARLSLKFQGQKVAAHGFPDRPPSAAPRLMVCGKCEETYAPRDRQDAGRCPQCGNAVRQAKHRQKVAKQRPGGDAMDRRVLARSGASMGEEWAPPADGDPALDEWDSDRPLWMLAEQCERRGEKARAADLRGLLRKGVTP
jgi:ribosomal protein S27AE